MALLEKAAGQGHAYAANALGGIYSVRKEFEQALQWYTKAAEAGLPKSIIMIYHAFRITMRFVDIVP
jgi:TPR repeat protein